MRSKIWRRLFLQITLILLVFAAIFTFSTGNFLYSFSMGREKSGLKSSMRKITERLSENTQALSDIGGVTMELRESLFRQIETENNYMIEILGETAVSADAYYITPGHALWESIYDVSFFGPGTNEPSRYQQRPLESLDRQITPDGGVFQDFRDAGNGLEYLTYRVALENNIAVQLTVQKGVVRKYSAMSSQFMVIILVSCLGLSLIWVFIYSRRFAGPIAEMNAITQNMAGLDFRRRLSPRTKDEIGQLGHSINLLADKLDSTLYDLSMKNAKLAREIELERSLETMRREFVANVSHELKTPIAIIQGYAEGIKMDVSGNQRGREEYADVIIQESDKMNLLVRDLLDLSQLQSDQIKLSLAEFHIKPLAQSVCGHIGALADKKGISVTADIPDITVYSDERRCEQILKNYLVNAVSHTPKDGEIKVSGEVRESVMRVSVFNTGSKIDEPDMEKIWQSFYRADKARSRGEGRYGLGLSIVSAIQKRLGMDCGAKNLENGVVFWFDVGLSDTQH